MTDGATFFPGPKLGAAFRPNVIWDIAQRQHATRRQERTSSASATNNISRQQRQAIFIGMRSCGKSTIIQRLTTRDAGGSADIKAPEYTIGLDYAYIKRQLKSTTFVAGDDEAVTDIWECAPTPYLSNLLSALIKDSNIAQTSLMLCVDLSQPAAIPSALESMLKTIAEKVTPQILSVAKPELVSDLKRKAFERCEPERSSSSSKPRDLTSLRPVLVPGCWIVGCKYDKFQDYEPEKKTLITKYLRLMARRYGLGLMYFHWKSESYTKRLRNLLTENLTTDADAAVQPSSESGSSSAAAETTTTTLASQFDHNKMIFIKPSDDDLNKIGALTPDTSTAQRGNADIEQTWKQAYGNVIKTVEAVEFSQTKPPDDIHWAQFREHLIDQIYNLKCEELARRKLLV